MTVCAIMMVKNEIDVVELTVRNLLAQCDEVFVADNLSTDGTLQLLQQIAFENPELAISIDDEVGYYQSAKMSAMAQLAFHRGHDWVVPADADEWWRGAKGRSVGEILAAQPKRAGVVRADVFNHYATVDDPADENPIRRLGWRTVEPLSLPKVAVRLWEDVRIDAGNHSALPPPRSLDVVRGLLEIRHYPYRSAEQFAVKAIQGNIAYRATDLERGLGLHWREYGERIEAEGVERGGHEWFNRFFRYDHPRLAGGPDDPQPDRELAAMVYDPVVP